MSYPYAADHPNTTRAGETESTPELPEIYQEAVTVDVKGIVEVANVVRSYIMPSRHGVSGNYSLGTGGIAVAIVGADPRRRRLTVVCLAPSGSASPGVYLGKGDAVKANNAALWPYNVPYVVEHTEEVYAAASGSGLATGHIVSFVAENWAD